MSEEKIQELERRLTAAEGKLAKPNWLAIASFAFAVIATVISYSQFNLARDINDQALSRIQFQALLEQDADGKYTLKILQVSGPSYVLAGIVISPSIEGADGKPVSAPSFTLGILKALQTDGNFIHYTLPDFGTEICARRPKFGTIDCSPEEAFQLAFSYRIHDKARPFQTIEIFSRPEG